MRITLTLEEVYERCADWETFCEEEGYSKWAVNEGGGDLTVSLTEQKAIKYGIIKGKIEHEDDNLDTDDFITCH